VLIVGAEVQSKGLKLAPQAKEISALFGDGTGACVLSKSARPAGIQLLDIALFTIENPSNHHGGGNSMPTLVWPYLTALLWYGTSTSGVALAEALQTVSHDRLTRMLQAEWSGQTLLELAVRPLFVWERGYLVLDDTVLPKPFATANESLA
jgi:hypothetical protein